MRNSDHEQLVLASDRGPVQFTESLTLVRRPGSVTSLLDRLARAKGRQTTWIAPSTAEGDRRAVPAGLVDQIPDTLGYDFRPVPVDKQQYDGYYDDIGIRLLWPVWHGITDEMPPMYPAVRPLDWMAPYSSINWTIADKIASAAAPNAIAAVQDYQLMLVPQMLHVRRPDMRIIHFTHTPFPTSEALFSLPLPIVKALVEGMLGADLLGFQRHLWASRFLECCARLGATVDHRDGRIRHHGHQTWVRCYPTPLDVVDLRSRSSTPGAQRWAARIRGDNRRQIIVRVDRLDPAKNALRGFLAYERLLDSDPELATRVRFVACLMPSRERIGDYRRYADSVWSTVNRISTRYPGSITVFHGDDHERALGALSSYDVLLVNAVADGLNIVALEGPTANHRDGAVVLSTGAGASDVLKHVISLTDPYDVDATADALRKAISLPLSRRQEMATGLRDDIADLGRCDWMDQQIADVAAARHGRSSPPGRQRDAGAGRRR